MGHYIIPGKVGPGVFLLVGLFWKSARYYSYEDMFIEAILVMICYNCLLAISFVVTVCEHCVILQQIDKYTYINKRVSLIRGQTG
jgi:hypothetical protein